jgi:hypothetical protein
LADHSAYRKTAESELANSERVDNRQYVTAQALDRVIARWEIRGAMAAHIAAQDPEMWQQIARLDIPLAVIAAE